MKISNTENVLKIDFLDNLVISNGSYLVDATETSGKIHFANGHFIFNDKDHSSLFTTLDFLGYSKIQIKIFKVLCWFLRKPIRQLKTNNHENQN